MAQKHYQPFRDEQGFVLILSLVLLILITLFGVWALQTSDFENKVAGNAQIAGRQFNLSEGANYTTAARVGSSRTGDNSWNKWFIPPDLVKDNQVLTVPEFNPGGREDETIPTSDNERYKPEDENTWPWNNLEVQYKEDGTVDKILGAYVLDYRYLVTYIGAQTATQGYDAGMFTAYTFRIQGNMAKQSMIVETGGKKIGMRLGL